MDNKKEYTIFQVIKADDKIQNPCDFNGENSPLSIEKQEEFLKTQYKAYRDRFGEKLHEKVASLKDAEKILADFEPTDKNEFREKLILRRFSASVIKKKSFENLVLYTKKTKIEGDRISFIDFDDYPVPCAKFECKEGLKAFSFGVLLDASYNTRIRSAEKGILTGRVVAFRKNGQNIFILQFYQDGSFSAKLVDDDQYHPEIREIGVFKFNKETVLTVAFGSNNVVVTAENKDYSFVINESFPDEVFFGGGMFPIGSWYIRPIRAVSVSSREVEVFKRADESETEENIGDVTLPYGVGTEKYKDKILKLRSEFNYRADKKKVILNISTIDPDGEVFLNGEQVIGVSNYGYIKSDVTKLINNGKNVLEISVNPRAPEETYQWHKNKDLYCAWGAGIVYLEKIDKTSVNSITVVTEKITRKKNTELIKAKFKVKLDSSRCKQVSVSAFIKGNGHKIQLAESTLKTTVGQTDISLKADFVGDAWSPQNPTLYELEIVVSSGDKIYDVYCETVGFRTIEQFDGGLLLNGEPLVMKGALLMQFLPPYDEIPVNHIFPTDEQITWQALLAKYMNCNTVRMHQLGYGTNDARFARIFDKLGLLCIWTTRLIDSLSTVLWNKTWKQSDRYREQMREVINHPSICVWEGINEISMSLKDIDCAYKEFVSSVKKIDKTRLICPVSNVYYDDFYSDDGNFNKKGERVCAAKEWNDPLVIRSAHPYVDYLGYGFSWNRLRNQQFSEQINLLKSKKHAYIMSEYAIIGRQDPCTADAKNFINDKSYEVSNEYNLGYMFDDRWQLSQAYQALSAEVTTKKALSLGVDGILWCSLNGGANDASYMKPPIDFYGYPKLSFFALKNYFNDLICFADDIETIWGKNYILHPVVTGNSRDKCISVNISIKDLCGNEVAARSYKNIRFANKKVLLSPCQFKLENGYYTVEYSVREE